jgi:hypothetical protein
VTSSALTVSVWFNATSLTGVAGGGGGGNPRLVANSHTDADVKDFQLMFNSGGPSGFFDVGNGTAEGRASWSQQLVEGTWHHYVGVYNGATVSAYLNGVQVASAAFAGGAIAAGTGPDINIARNPAYTGDYFNGAIYDVRIYEQALSAAPVLALYQAVTPPPPNGPTGRVDADTGEHIRNNRHGRLGQRQCGDGSERSADLRGNGRQFQRSAICRLDADHDLVGADGLGLVQRRQF